MAPKKVKLQLAQDQDADALLSTDPLALLIGMVLDQQIPLEWAFKGPHMLQQRLGHPLDANQLAAMDPDDLIARFVDKPALHRYPAAMAKRVQEMCQVVVDDYDGDAAKVWTTAADGQELFRRIKALPGFGEMKARIFVALLAKQFGVEPPGWEKAAGEFGQAGTFKSVADIVDGDSLGRVREYKQAKKAAAKAKAAAEQPA